MDNLSTQLAYNLRQIRKERKLSLDDLAALSGVSKSMLGQIERGESNPTIITLWKIANGLKVPFSQLLSAPQADVTIMRCVEIEPLVEDNGRYRLYPLYPIEEGRRFEVYRLEIDRGGYLGAEPHPDGTEEFLTLFAGSLTVRVGEEELTLEKGDSVRFRADRPHVYHNAGQELVSVSMVIHYP